MKYLEHAYETLAKTHETIANIHKYSNKTLAIYV
jgi:hypothetical protein